MLFIYLAAERAFAMKVLLTASPWFQLQKDANAIDINSEKKNMIPTLAIYQLGSVIREKHRVQVLDPVVSNFEAPDKGPVGIFDIDTLSALRFPALESSLAGVDAVGISSTSFDWFLARVMSSRIKEVDPDLPVIVGGVHPSLADGYILDSSEVDYVVRGEGERTLPELLDALEKGCGYREIDGVSWRSNESVIRNEDRAPLTARELEEIPLPAFDLMPPNVYGKIGVESSRGCRFDCSFCSLLFKRLWRGLRPEAVLKKIEHAADHSGKLYGDESTVDFVDGTFTADPKRSEKILEGLKDIDLGNLGIAFEGRADDIVSSNIMKLCQGLSIDYIFVGVECGYNKGMQKIGKGTSLKTVERCASVGSDYHVPLRYSFIIGFPWETKEECLKTIAFADRLVSEYGGLAYINWFYLLPGSRILEARGTHEITEALDSYSSLHNRSREYRLKISSRLTEEDISEIDREIDKLNLMRIVNGGNAGFAGTSRLSGISNAGAYILTRTGGFIEKTLPYCGAETKLLSQDLR
jgi:anaerobic magnesium-protoporphyrin IX monomethyl ester cyclase